MRDPQMIQRDRWWSLWRQRLTAVENPESLGARRQEFIRAMRVHSPESRALLLKLVKEADVSDLEWLMARIDDQIRNVPMHVKIAADRDMILKEAEHRRSWIGSVLDNKRSIAQRQEAKRSQLQYALIVLIGLLTLVATVVGFLV